MWSAFLLQFYILSFLHQMQTADIKERESFPLVRERRCFTFVLSSVGKITPARAGKTTIHAGFQYFQNTINNADVVHDITSPLLHGQ